jgi:hypothetical protein
MAVCMSQRHRCTAMSAVAWLAKAKSSASALDSAGDRCCNSRVAECCIRAQRRTHGKQTTQLRDRVCTLCCRRRCSGVIGQQGCHPPPPVAHPQRSRKSARRARPWASQSRRMQAAACRAATDPSENGRARVELSWWNCEVRQVRQAPGWRRVYKCRRLLPTGRPEEVEERGTVQGPSR